MTLPSPPASLEQLIQTASTDKDYKPVWRQLVRTRLFAASDAGDASQPGSLRIRPGKKDGKPTLLVAQQREQLPVDDSTHARQMFGGEIINALPAGVALGLVLGNGVFTIPGNLVDWLRGNLQKTATPPPTPATPATPASVASPAAPSGTVGTASNSLGFPTIDANFPPISMPQDEPKPKPTLPPLPTIPSGEAVDVADLIDMDLLAKQTAPVAAKPDSKSAPPPATSPATAQPSGKPVAQLTLAGSDDDLVDTSLFAPASTKPAAAKAMLPFDSQSLNPRHVDYPALGLEFFVPNHWRESMSGSTVHFIDPQNQTKITVNSMQRDNVPLERWLEMRLPTVTKDMPFLQQVEAPYPVHGSEWRDRISAKATEFKGTFHLDTEETHYLICCLRSDTTLVAVTIRASGRVFEANRALYQWLFAQMNITDMALPPVKARPGQRNSAPDDGPVPALIGFNTSGRLGRLRYFAYSGIIWLPIILIVFGVFTILQNHAVLGMMILAVTVLWLPMRLVVMRMHDINLSGKWLLGLLLMAGVGGGFAGAMQKPGLISLVSALFWLAILAISFLPGSSDENDYGEVPAPNPLWVKIVAGVFLVLQLVGMVGMIKIMIKGGNPWGGSAAMAGRAAAPQESRNFSPPDKIFSVLVPGQMQENPMREPNPPGIQSQHIYTLATSEHNYFIQDMQFTMAPPGREEVLDQLRDNFVANMRGEIIGEKPVRVDGFSGRDVRFKTPSGSIEDMRILLSGTRLFVVMIESPQGIDNQERVDAFLGSFHIN